MITKQNFYFFSCDNQKEILTIGLVGKYFRNDKIFSDAYASVIKALDHSTLAVSRKLKIHVILFLNFLLIIF